MPKIMSVILNIVMWVLILYLIIKIIYANQQNKKNKALIETMSNVGNKEIFNQKIYSLEKKFQVKNPVFLQKTEVLKMWGLAIYEDYEELMKVLSELKPDLLLSKKQDQFVLEANEDSFFFLYISIPNILYGNGHKELISPFFEKLCPIIKKTETSMVTQIGLEAKKLYLSEEDKGQKFYQMIINGEYENIKYYKAMIGIYKAICVSLLAKIAKDKNDQEAYANYINQIHCFNLSGACKRFVNNLHLDLSTSKENAEKINETMVMEKLTDVENEDHK